MSRTQAERITSLEDKVENLTTLLQKVSDQQDALLALRNKGAGAFWLASILFGTGIISLAYMVAGWLKG